MARECFHPRELPRMAPYKNCRLDSSKVIGLKDVVCKDQPYIKAFSFPIWLDVKKPVVYKSCAGNEEAAMRYRYMKETPEMNLDLQVFEECYLELEHLLEINGPIQPLSMPEFLNTKTGALHKRYREAAEAVYRDGLDLRRDSRVTPFIKNEKYFEEGKFPRLVYSRSPKFGALWARFILPIEHALMKLPEVAKGKNYMQRGKAFADRVYCPGKGYVENDMSQFEASQRAQLFDMVQKRMLTKFYHYLKHHWWPLYEEHLTKHGWTLRGLWYYLFGLMASGDFETGCFNTIFNWLSCRYFEKKNGFGERNFIVDGDDSVIQCPLGVEVINTFSDFGFQAKLIKKTGYQSVDFCSSKFIQIRPGTFYQVQDLRKLLSSIPYMINKNFDNSLADYYGSLGYMYSVLYAGIPIYSQLANFLKTASSNYVNSKMLSTAHYGAYNAFSAERTDIGFVDPLLASIDISIAFEIPLVELEQLSKWLNSSSLQFEPDRSIPYTSRERPVKYTVDVAFLDTYVVHGTPHPRPKWYGQL